MLTVAVRAQLYNLWLPNKMLGFTIATVAEGHLVSWAPAEIFSEGCKPKA